MLKKKLQPSFLTLLQVFLYLKRSLCVCVCMHAYMLHNSCEHISNSFFPEEKKKALNHSRKVIESCCCIVRICWVCVLKTFKALFFMLFSKTEQELLRTKGHHGKTRVKALSVCRTCQEPPLRAIWEHCGHETGKMI